MSTAEQAWQAWCEERDQAVSAVPGNLALVSYQPVGEDVEPVYAVDGLSVHRPAGAEGVVISLAGPGNPDDSALPGEVSVDGRPVSGDIELGRLRPDGTPILRTGRFHIDAFSLDGSDYELRIYDEQADNLGAFAGIERYPYDPALVVTGEFRASDREAVPWEFTRTSDTGHTKQVPGTIVVDLDGTEYALTAFLDGPQLVLVFADGTTRVESYAPGRFLRSPCPEGTGEIVVDFNRTFIPPCGFSDFYSCPIPPAQNVLPMPIRAGEKRVTWTSPRH